jgi:chorismate dehydratase
LEGIRHVALDANSRTSAALVRVLLAERYGLEPEYVTVPPSGTTSPGDAVLLIGDPAMRRQREGESALDLGEAWTEWTGLPFVFAVWAVRPDVATGAIVEALTEAKRRGLRAITEIAQREARRRGFPPDVCLTYLREVISYDLTTEHLKGLRRFLEFARKYDLLGEGPDPEELLL